MTQMTPAEYQAECQRLVELMPDDVAGRARLMRQIEIVVPDDDYEEPVDPDAYAFPDRFGQDWKYPRNRARR
jgi:hypothetical protein